MARRPAVALGRPPVQHTAVRDALRRRILAGEWEPGVRLPPRTRLIRELDTTSSTLQSALDELIADGLVVTRGALGTFVHERSPHRFRFGLVFPQAVDDFDPGSRFWQALSAAAAGWQDGSGRTIAIYSGRHWQVESPSYERLLADLGRHQLAGLVVVAPPRMFAGSPVLTAPVPRLFVSAGPMPAGDAKLGPDWASFRSLAVRRCAELGCRRVAVVAGAGLLDLDGETAAWRREFEAARIDCPETWLVGADLLFPRPIAATVRLLLRQSPAPDGLVVADDNLLPTVFDALAAEKPAPGRGIRVLAHANLPLPPDDRFPVERIAFDARQMLATALDACTAWYRGRSLDGLDLVVQARAVAPPA